LGWMFGYYTLRCNRYVPPFNCSCSAGYEDIYFPDALVKKTRTH
jgi:hypothetical protein